MAIPGGAGVVAPYSSAAPDANMQSGSITVGGSATALAAGGNESHENRQPYLTMSYCISLFGVFPSP